jgi:quinol monooxygenase YgiN
MARKFPINPLSLLSLVYFVIGAWGLSPGAQASEVLGKITVVSHVDIIPDAYVPHSEEEAAALFRDEIAATKMDNGLVSYEVLEQIDGPNHFTIVEAWSDSKAYAGHAASPHTIAFRRKIQAYLGSPFDSRVHQAFR